jgi:cytochrome c biogenesis protein CcdA
MHLFSYDCRSCRRLLRVDLPRWAEDHEVTLAVHYYDLGVRGTYDLLVAAGADFGRQDTDIPTLFVGKSVFGGEGEIAEGVPKELAHFRRDPARYREQAVRPFAGEHDTRAMRAEQFRALTTGIVMGAGLLDGLNPCAFTTLIFLISYLSLVGSSRRQILVTGGFFSAAVFLTYLLIGVLFFQFSRALLNTRWVSVLIHVLLLGVLAILAILSAADFFRCRKGRATEITLQLPDSLKARIRERIRKYARSRLGVSLAAFVLGVVIAGMELACTGQVYIPIVTMISEPRYRGAAVSYLIVYNVAFVVPLVAVFLLVAFGVTSERLGVLFTRHVALVKFGFTALFVAMAAIIVYNVIGLL